MQFKIGETVRFRRSNGSWSEGEVKSFNGDFVNIFWLCDGGDFAEKKCRRLNVKKLQSSRNLYLFVFVVVTVSLLLVDSFFYTKKFFSVFPQLKINSFYYF